MCQERLGDLLAGHQGSVVQRPDQPVDEGVEVGSGRQLATVPGTLQWLPVTRPLMGEVCLAESGRQAWVVLGFGEERAEHGAGVGSGQEAGESGQVGEHVPGEVAGVWRLA
jgi:hypothetical protein